MIAILSGAWWAQKLASPVLQALGGALAVAVVAGSIGLGLMWLRADARADGRAGIVVERDGLKAEIALLKAAAARQAKTLEARADAIAESEEAVTRLRQELEEARRASPNPKTVVVPPGDPWLDRDRPDLRSLRLPKRP